MQIDLPECDVTSSESTTPVRGMIGNSSGPMSMQEQGMMAEGSSSRVGSSQQPHSLQTSHVSSSSHHYKKHGHHGHKHARHRGSNSDLRSASQIDQQPDSLNNHEQNQQQGGRKQLVYSVASHSIPRESTRKSTKN